ncbi:MAG TPA: LamG-like jellyroll fold domain-containing protein [Prolixibacteraceae bacterium]
MKIKSLLFTLLLAVLFTLAANAQVPNRQGWWKFDDPTNLLKAEIGSPLEVSGSQLSVDGPQSTNKATQINPGSYLIMTHGIPDNGGGTALNEYSIQIDFSVPQTGIWHSFLQTDPDNASDADLFTNTTNAIGVAEIGYSAKGIAADTWYRMIISVRNGEFFKVYIDGALWLDGAGKPVDGRFALQSSLLLFADNDGEDGTILCSELGIWDTALEEAQILELGGATGERVPVRTKLGSWKFDDPTNLLKAEIGNPLQLTGTQQSVDGPMIGNKATKIDAGSYLKMTHGILPHGGGALVNEYTLQIDFSVPQTGIMHSFFQTDVTNTSDAELLTNLSGAIGTAATTYSSSVISANTWYRMLVVVKNGEFFKIYVNGELWLDAAGQPIDGRFALANDLLLFADNDGEDGTILCSELGIWEVALTETEIADLGGSPGNQLPDRVGWWKFEENGNPEKADIGYPLMITGNVSTVPGPAFGNNAIQVDLGEYLLMNHGIYGNGEGSMVNDYSLQIDFSVPEAGIWHAFFQTDPTNTSDADLFTNTSNAIGTGATSYSSKTIAANTWYRMVITVKNGSYFRVYLNGEPWLEAAGQTVDGRFALSPELLIFADNDGDDGQINCSELAIWEVPLSAEQVALLGNALTIPVGIRELQQSQVSSLGQNYPNPFSSHTIFPYEITKAGKVNFRILDSTGKVVRSINEGIQSPGKYSLSLGAENLTKGIYYLQMITNTQTSVRKMAYIP